MANKKVKTTQLEVVEKESKIKQFYNESKGYFVSIINVLMAIYVKEQDKVFIASIVNSILAIIDACVNYFVK